MKIDGAIFDVDGTLLDTMGMWSNSANAYLEQKGIQAENLAGVLFSYTLEMSSAYLKKRFSLSESEDEILSSIIQFVYNFYSNDAQLRPGCLEVLGEFQKKSIPMVVVSSGDLRLIDAAFSRLGLHKFFKKIITGSKNSLEIFLSALEILGTKAENTIVFEDAIFAAETAKKAGFKVCGINEPNSQQNQEELKKYCDIYIENWSEFKIS